jgi:hypothetical protein
MPDETLPLSVEPGRLVRVEVFYATSTEQITLVIVPDEQADFAAGFLGAGTPLAQAILGEKAGTKVPYFSGDAMGVQILSVEKTDLSPDEDAALRRERKLRQAVEQSERTSAMMFASSFSGKWGDYDPEAVDQEENDSPSSTG